LSRNGKVAVIGAGFYGSTTALRLAEYDIFDEVVLTDIIEGKPEGLALDMNQSRPVEGFETRVTGQTTGPNGEGYEAVAGAGIVVVTAGLPRKPGMSRMDLIEVNAKIVRNVVENVAKHAPEAVLIVVSNPLDEMTALAAKVSGFRSSRVLDPGDRHERVRRGRRVVGGGDHRRAPPQAGHEPDGPDRGKRQDRPQRGGERGQARAGGGAHRGLQPAG